MSQAKSVEEVVQKIRRKTKRRVSTEKNVSTVPRHNAPTFAWKNRPPVSALAPIISRELEDGGLT